MKAFHLSQQWDAKLGFDLACYKVELGSFDFFSYQCWEFLIIFTFSMVLSFFLFLSFHHGWYEDEKGNLFCFSKSHHFYFLVFTGCLTSKLFFQDSCFCIIAKVSKNKAVSRWLQEFLNHCIFYCFDQNNRRYELPDLLNFYWR